MRSRFAFHQRLLYTFDYSRISRRALARFYRFFHLDYSNSFSHLSAARRAICYADNRLVTNAAAAASIQMSNILIISSSLSLSAASTSASSSSVGGLVSRGCPLPPEIPGGQYQILPVRRNFSSASVSPISSRFLNLMNFSSLSVPIYSSALYSCHRGFLSGGSSLISCSPGGWWQPTHNAPRCVPYGSSAASSSSSSASGTHHQHNSHGTSPPPPSPPPWFLSSSPGGGLVVDERVTGRLMGVRCPQFPRQHRRWTIDCGFDLEAGSSDVANSSNRTRPLPILCWPAVLFIASARIWRPSGGVLFVF